MAYTPILNAEVTQGATLDETLLGKIKTNFDALKSTTEVHDSELADQLDAIQLHENALISHAGTLSTHTTDIANNTAEINDLKTQDPWITPGLTNGWSYYEPAQSSHPGLQYYKDEMGTVHLRGMVKGSSTSPMTTLPAGFRPGKYCIFACYSGSSICRIDVDPSGVINYNGGGTPTSWVSLMGISFRAEQ